jgi:hypothetical protein
MIQLLSTRYCKSIACLLMTLFYASVVLPVYGRVRSMGMYHQHNYMPVSHAYAKARATMENKTFATTAKAFNTSAVQSAYAAAEQASPAREERARAATVTAEIDGPGQPEMSSFKSVGTDNLVNLFSGDFSYNIPLLDVGGYPINIFYNGGIGMEQEASWVGLGWNINPGNINRNMRGVPDDFNGQDTLIQQQNMKPNKTWGARAGADLELVGIKSSSFFGLNVGASLGVSFNNYLGPALDFGFKGTTSFKVAQVVGSEKSTVDSMKIKIGAGIGGNISSRYGTSFSPSLSLTANAFKKDRTLSGGLNLATSYNSRNGIKDLQISGQMSFGKREVEKSTDEDGNEHMKVVAGGRSGSYGTSLYSSSISFAKPSYIPAIRIPLTNTAYSGHFQLGGAIFGTFGSAEIEVYKQTSQVSAEQVTQKKPLVGYLYYEKAMNNPNAVMDFTRFNDKEVTASSPVISAPQYTYDVFSIQGEGTGGSVRAYRNDLGYVRDNNTGSKDKSLGIGVDIGIPGHFGANVNTISTPTTISEWGKGNKLKSAIAFTAASGLHENVYFRNPGESSVLSDNQFDQVGGTDLVRFQLGGTGYNPTVEPVLERFSATAARLGTTNVLSAIHPDARKKRTQVINFLTAAEASLIGLDQKIKSYNPYVILNENHILQYEELNRVEGYRKAHHISQINVTEGNGRRYVYGIPVYNTIQRDFTFTVQADEVSMVSGKVSYDSAEANVNTNPAINGGTGSKDGYVQVSETPGYAHSFLLSGLLSPDYVDITGDGITEDDLGTAVKFNYTRIKKGDQPALHKWRTPADKDNSKASFNTGNHTERRDDKGLVSYGERESWYTHSIESKTMIALFFLGNRKDGKGPASAHLGTDAADTSSKLLQRIELYSKADLKKNGLTGAGKAKPIKTVHFAYSYTLCQGTPDNTSTAAGEKGKLTLDSIYFTYNGQQKVNKEKYVFSYTNGAAGNPDYAYNASDRWGNYKPTTLNPDAMENSEYPYCSQDKNNKTTLDEYAGAWSLKKILLPSGGQIEVNYESDDYAFVQNKRAAAMMQVAGFGSAPTSFTNRLFEIRTAAPITENDYLFVRVPEPCASRKEIFYKYLQGMDQLSVRLAVNMPKGVEYLNSYAVVNARLADSANYGIYSTDPSIIWIRMNEVDGLSPLSLTVVEYLREQLPGQAFKGYDVSDEAGLEQVATMLAGMWDGLKNAFSDPVNVLRGDGNAQSVVTARSFVRLNDPDGYKYGGGQRVKSVKLKDNWQAMTGQYTSIYGQEYNYTTTEVVDGATRIISSGVASYEPSIGGDENPFQRIIQVSNQLPMGPTSYGAVEMPVLDAFFPSPLVGYSKVTVKSLPAVSPAAGQKSKSGIGRQVTEFYTAKDYPVQYSYTSFDPASDKQLHQSSLMAFFSKYAYDYRSLSQGFLVANNDMHGKLRSQASYAENDTTLRVNYTENFYRNTGNKGLDEKFDFVHASKGGEILPGNIGIDIELMTDLREFSVKSNSVEVQAQVDLFPVLFPIWLPFIWPVIGQSENTYRAVTTTKVINYHSVLDSVSVIDKGSQVGTKNMVYDAETGEVIVNRTNNEHRQPIYTTSYPAYWAYSGMGLAYKNIDARFASVNFYDGKITNSGFDTTIFESGDELLVLTSQPSTNSTCDLIPSSLALSKIWAFDQNKNATSLTSPGAIVFMDGDGKTFTRNNASIRIVRSGKRNRLDAPAADITSMKSPVVVNGPVRKLFFDADSKVIAARASEYKEKWQTDNDAIGRFTTVTDPNTCIESLVCDPAGNLEKSINPYRKGLLGNFSASRGMVYYHSRISSDPAVATNLPQDGFLSDFKPYWDFNTANNLVPDLSNAKWVWNSEITRINAKGAELENRNALNIYTAAQYGYNKSLPVSITNNARYQETAYAGFEDGNYQESISNNSASACGIKHLDFGGLANSAIITANASNITAHTGQQVLAVNANSTAIKQIPVTIPAVDTFPLVLGSTIAKTLTTPGVNLEYINKYPQTVPLQEIVRSNPLSLEMYPAYLVSSNGGIYYHYDFKISGYVKLDEKGQYQISKHYWLRSGSLTTASITVEIFDVDNNQVPLTYISDYETPPVGAVDGYTFYKSCLNKGIYRVELTGAAYFNVTCPDGDCDFDVGTEPSEIFDIGFSTFPDYYKNATTANGCVATVPIAGNNAMLNPVFSMPVDKKMLVSAWVKDDCINQDNNCSQVQVIHNGTGSIPPLKPVGPVIDGWQRVEGDVTLPANATSMSLSLINNTSHTIYFDDIRIHPYNANMKSYVYDPVNLRLTAELDANNYATFYEYDEEGTLIRTKAETREGIKTITETRSSKQKKITTIQ